MALTLKACNVSNRQGPGACTKLEKLKPRDKQGSHQPTPTGIAVDRGGQIAPGCVVRHPVILPDGPCGPGLRVAEVGKERALVCEKLNVQQIAMSMADRVSVNHSHSRPLRSFRCAENLPPWPHHVYAANFSGNMFQNFSASGFLTSFR